MANQTIPNGSGQIENVRPDSWRKVTNCPKPIDQNIWLINGDNLLTNEQQVVS